MNKIFLVLSLWLLWSSAWSQDAPRVVSLWENGAPGFEDRKDEPERAQDWWVKNIHNPSVTIFQPEEPNGSFVLICPGGGHRALVYNSEGLRAAPFFTELGVTVGVLKYRLFREEGSPYTIEHPGEDAIRAIRKIRSMAEELEIETERIGIMGFSAGGEIVNMVAFEKLPGNPGSDDPVESYPAHPNFQIQIYPGPLGVPDSVSASAPPAFLLAANHDECCSEPIFLLLKAYRKAGADVEAHFYAKDGHAFNMGTRSEFQSIQHWPDRLADWLVDHDFFRN